MTIADADAQAAFEIANRIDKQLIGNDLAVCEIAMAVVVAKLALARKGRARDHLGKFFERVDGILIQWEEDAAQKALLNLTTQGTIQ